MLALLIPTERASAQPVAEPTLSVQVEHPSNVPVADIFGGSYVDSSDDPLTGLGAHDPGLLDMTIGEEFNIIITISYPDGTTNNTFFISQSSPRTEVVAFDGTVIEVLSAEVIHTGSNLSGTGVPALGNLTVRDLNPPDGDGSQFQFGNAMSDVTAVADGVTDDRDRIVIRVRSRLDDEDAAGGAADALPDVANVDAEIAANRAQIASDFGSGSQQQQSRFARIDVVEPEVTVGKTSRDGEGLLIGEVATFELLISNTGTAPAYNVVVTDTLPSSGPDAILAFGSLDAGASSCDDIAGFQLDAAAPPAVVFTFDLLAAGSSCSLVFETTVEAGAALNQTYTNIAAVTAFDSRADASSADSRSYAGGSDSSTVNTGEVDLQLTKGAPAGPLLPGDPIVYTLDAVNAGSRDAVGVTLLEEVPAHTTFDAGSSTPGWSCADGSVAGTACSFDLGTLASSGGADQALFAVRVNAPLPVRVTAIDNLASLDDDGSGGDDADPDNNRARASTPVTNTASLTVVKSATPRDGTDFTFTGTLPGDGVSSRSGFDAAPAGAATGLAVAGAGILYVLADGGDVEGFDGAGAPTGFSFNTGLGAGHTGLALGEGGLFWVLENTGAVTQFDALGNPTGVAFDTLPNARGLAVDAVGNVLVLVENGDIARFTRRGDAIGVLASSGLPAAGAGLSVDNAGKIWAIGSDGTAIELDSQGAATGFQFNAGLGAPASAIAVGGVGAAGGAISGAISVADAAGRVETVDRAGREITLDDEPTQTDAVESSITVSDLPIGTYSLTEVLPANWVFVGAQCVGGGDSGVVVGTMLSVDLAAGEAVTCTVSNDLPRVDIQVSQSESPDPVVAGSGVGNLSYVVTAGNAGPSDATGLQITETLTLPPGVTVASVTPSLGTYSSPAWNVGALPSGSSATLTLTLTVDATASIGTDVIASTAALSAVDQVELEPSNDSATETTSIVFSSVFDFGDAPNPYPTRLASNGARHGQPSALFLGASVDAEADGQPADSALGDDVAGTPDDEDGLAAPPSLAPGTSPILEVTASASGVLSAWIDFDRDGAWGAGEQVLADVPVTAGVNALAVAIPADALFGPTIARFRVASVGGLAVTGAAADGEVEDHQVLIGVSADDTDGDGVPNVVEDGAPELGDGNGDGVVDRLQSSVTSLPSAAAGSFLTLETLDAGCGFAAVEAVDPASLPEDVGAVTYQSIQGFVGFELECAEASVSVIYHFESPLLASAYRQYGPTPDLAADHWYSLDATLTTREVEGFPSATATFLLRDGEVGDHDLSANGAVVALGGLTTGASTPTEIPTLSI
ncbi:MAG: GEVED domain-containing protein [Acidobacteriota bacterium]